jgi:hypothetical protein
MTQTQPGPLNGDLAGVGRDYDRNATFSQLGAFTSPMSAANPVAVGLGVAIDRQIGDGNLSATENASVTLRGTTPSGVAIGTWVKVTVKDGANTPVTRYAQVSSQATWEVAADLSSLSEGTLTATAELWTSGSDTGTRVGPS